MLFFKDLLSLIDKHIHIAELLDLLGIAGFISFLHLARESRKARKEHKKIVVKELLPVRMNDNRLNVICAVFIEFDTVHSAVCCSDLVLPAASLITHDSLKIDSFVGKFLLVSVFALKSIEGIKHSDCK